MGQKQGSAIDHYRHFFIIILGVIVLSFVFLIIALLNIFSQKLYDSENATIEKISLENLENIREAIILKDSPLSNSRNYRCSYYDCFNVYRCGRKGLDQISIYVYPLRKFVDEYGQPLGPYMTKEFYTILKTIVNSKYYTVNPKEACILVPSIDTLNQNRLQIKEISQALGSLL